ncbi:hypothetical protein PHLCEN_2v858 [Hermanssonia centrifuga]|uniref:DUF6534 domain-containing protein n=1 Tax=Hermanssonia centrifuga TaxID=98765 RepID=A0A2R6S4Z2_9APHY|nr:hypothetical protein PHLCEN_2v858 [Hermanssonia centrifuga]
MSDLPPLPPHIMYGMLFLETVQTALTGADAYYWFASGFGDIRHLENSYISAFDSPFLSSVIALIVQFFFCHRIWKMEKKFWSFCVLTAAVSLTQAAGGIASGVVGLENNNFAAASRKLGQTVAYIWLLGDALADVMIAGAMIYLLQRARSTDHERTNTILAKWVRLTMETNAVTAAVATFAFVLHVAAPEQSYFICPTFFIGRLYSNSLYLTFNNRLSFQTLPMRPAPSSGSSNTAVTKAVKTSQGSFSSAGEASPSYIIGTFEQSVVVDGVELDTLNGSVSLRQPLSVGFKLMSLSLAFLALSLALCISCAHYYTLRRRGNLPPGPVGLPFIGNLLDMRVLFHPEALTKWSHEYGDITYLKTFSKMFLVINTPKAALQLLEKRGALYSDRPQQPMACDLVGLNRVVILTPMGERFRQERKLMNTVLNPRAVTNWEPLMTEQVQAMLREFLEVPEQLSDNLRR